MAPTGCDLHVTIKWIGHVTPRQLAFSKGSACSRSYRGCRLRNVRSRGGGTTWYTSVVCRTQLKRSICLLYQWEDTAFWLAEQRGQSLGRAPYIKLPWKTLPCPTTTPRPGVTSLNSRKYTVNTIVVENQPQTTRAVCLRAPQRVQVFRWLQIGQECPWQSVPTTEDDGSAMSQRPWTLGHRRPVGLVSLRKPAVASDAVWKLRGWRWHHSSRWQGHLSPLAFIS